MFPQNPSYFKPYFKRTVRKILKRLKVRPILEISVFFKKKKIFYSSPCFKKFGKKERKVFLKILITDKIAPIEAIKREIEIRKFLANFKKIKFPHLILRDNKQFPYWFLSEYFSGELLGHFYEIYINDKELIPQLVNFLFNLQQIPQKNIKKLFLKRKSYLWKRGGEDYLEMVKHYQKRIKKDIAAKIDFSKIYRLFEKEKSVFKKYPLVLTHGDFTLTNLVISPKKSKLIITDWEQAHLDSFAYDISHLWIQLWRYPDWQKNWFLNF